MVLVSHAVFIDESGLSLPGNTIQSLWIATAVAVALDRSRILDQDTATERSRLFRSRVKEFKGHLIKHSELLSGVTADDVAAAVAGLLRKYDAHVWTVATIAGCPVPIGFVGPIVSTKSIARQLLLERVNGLLGTGRYAPAHWMMVWDVSDVQELTDFSSATASFANGYTGQKISDRLYPMVLGGLSHDWAGLQLADIVAHLALHKVGAGRKFPDANPRKGAAFDARIEPVLQRDQGGRVVGWKTWGL